MLGIIVRLCAALLFFATATASSAAQSASSPTPGPSPSLCPCAAIGASGNIYTLISTLIWAVMWLSIAFIAKSIVSKIVEGSHPKY